MKKEIIFLGVIFAVFLMVSSATAVPTINSKPMVEKMNEMKQINDILDVKAMILNQQLTKTEMNQEKLKNFKNTYINILDLPNDKSFLERIFNLIYSIALLAWGLFWVIPNKAIKIICGWIDVFCCAILFLLAFLNLSEEGLNQLKELLNDIYTEWRIFLHKYRLLD